MLNQEKIHLMSRLAMLEKEKGKELRGFRESFRSDYIGIPLLKITEHRDLDGLSGGAAGCSGYHIFVYFFQVLP